MKTHNSNSHDKNENYSCNICGQQVSHKNSLVSHKRIVHDGIKYPCRQCSYQVGWAEKSKMSKIYYGHEVPVVIHKNKDISLFTF